METTIENSIIEALNWRYATKSFDSTKKLNTAQLNSLLDAVQLAPSSYGLQPYQVIVVSNQEIKEKLKVAAYNQVQLAEASHIFVFAIHKEFHEGHVNEYVNNIARTRNIEISSIQGFVDIMKGAVNSRTTEQLALWNARQAYIALGVLLETAAISQIDACPMEGFNNAAFDEILDLADRNLTSIAIAPVGFRSENDAYQHYAKVRKSKEDLFIHI